MVKHVGVREHGSCEIRCSSLILCKDCNSRSFCIQLVSNWLYNPSDTIGNSYRSVNIFPAFSSMFCEWVADKQRATAQCLCLLSVGYKSVCPSKGNLIGFTKHSSFQNFHTFYWRCLKNDDLFISFKGHCHAIWQLYETLEGVFASTEFQN